MPFLTKRVRWANWQFGVLKISTLAIGIILGAMYSDFWRPLLWLVGLVAIITGVWATAIWIRAMRMSEEDQKR